MNAAERLADGAAEGPAAAGPASVDARAARRERRAERTAAEKAERAARREKSRRRSTALVRTVRAAVRWLPLPVACLLGEALGRLAYLAVPWVRRQTLANLERAYGDAMSPAERRRVARRSFGLAGRGVLAFVVMHRMGIRRAIERVEIVTTPDLDAHLATGRGGIGLTQHFGMFELAAIAAATRVRVLGVGADTRGDDATSILIAMRGDLGVPTVQQGNARELVRRLRDGWIAGMLLDQDVRKVNGVFVPFFGRPTCTPRGPVALALRLGIPLIRVTAEWTSLTRHRVTYGPLIHPREDLSGEDRELELVARCVASGEAEIRRRPEHWLWMHERWRTRPEDAPDAPRWPREEGRTA